MAMTERDHVAATEDAKRGQAADRCTSRPRRRRLLAGGLLIGLLLLAFAPQIVAWSALRHHLPRLRLRGFQEEIRVGSASLSWWGPIELSEIELDSSDGKPCVTVKRVTEDRGVWTLLFRRQEPLHVRIEEPVVTLLVRPGGSNLEDAFAPVKAHPRPWRPNRERSFDVVNGRIEITDATTGRTAEWSHVGLHAKSEPGQTVPAHLELTAKSAEAPEAKPLRLVFNQSGLGLETLASQRAWDAKLEMADLPMAALGPLLGRLIPDLEISGTVTAEVDLHSNSDASATTTGLTGAEWTLTTRELQFGWPSRIGADRPMLGEIRFEGKISADSGECRVERLSLVTDVGRLTGSGAFPMSVADPAEGQRHDGAQPRDRDFTLEGEIDLVGLAQLLPSTLALREGASLTEGKVVVHAASRSRDGRTGWSGRVETPRLAARLGGEEIAWNEPLEFRFNAHAEGDRIEFDELECRSEVVHLTGRGNSRNAHLEAGCDFERLAARFRQFFNADSFEMHGTATAAVDLERHPERGLIFKTRGDVENLLLRRQVTTMVDRRRGDIEPINVEAPAESLPPPGLPVDRRGMRLQRRAEREAQRDARRRENEARKMAKEMVAVPVEEWRTIWSEPRLELVSDGRFVRESNLIELNRVEVASDGVYISASGSIAELFSRCVVDLDGQAECDMERIVERLREVVGPHLHIKGKESRRFAIHGPLRAPGMPAGTGPLVPSELTAKGALAWSSGNLFGLAAGPEEIELALADCALTMRPLELAVSGGKVTLAPQVLLGDRPAMLAVPAGPVIENVELTDEVCDSWMKYINPIVAEATRAQGRFSLDLDETRLALADPASGEVSGRLQIDSGRLLPGPLFAEISELIGRIASAISRNPPRDLLGIDRPLVEMDRQTVDFKLQGRRVYHSPVEFKVRSLLVRTHGSVGIDQTLDVIAEIAFSDEFVSRAKILAPLAGRTLEIPIQGTLRKPVIDRGAIGQLLKKLVPSAVEGLINNGIQKIIERRQ
ncbi:MAG TPA: hypothetical protein VGY55_08520 [Pirellulales bacterium]|jgi:hypothetical protein|nr:hypothetical protein [Pirellulales bacterium]